WTIRKRQVRIPRTGRTGTQPKAKGTRKGLGSSGSFRLKVIRLALMTTKVAKRMKSLALATKAMSPEKRKAIERSMTATIATIGVLLPGWTRPRTVGNDADSAMP